MKIAGTYQPKQDSPAKNPMADTTTDNGAKTVWCDINMEGMTRDQKKKLRKKLQRKRRKQQKRDDETADGLTSHNLDDTQDQKDNEE